MTQQPLPPPVPPLRGLHITVAGAAGGVGTTTIASLLADAIIRRTGIPVRIVDHVGGTLSTRLNGIHPASRFTIHDLGPLAPIAARQTTTPDTRTIIVTSPDTNAVDLTLDTFRHLTANTPSPPSDQYHIIHHLIIVNTTSRHKPPDATTSHLQNQAPGATIIPLPWDPQLTTPYPINQTTLTPATNHTIAQILQLFGL